jgi:hypothetical protein
MSRAELSFFFRLLYTGQVDESDWAELASIPSFNIKVPDDSEPAMPRVLDGIYKAAGSFRGAPKFLNRDSKVLLYRGEDAAAQGNHGEASSIWKLSWWEDIGEMSETEKDANNELSDDKQRLESLWTEASMSENFSDSRIGWDFSQKGGSLSSPPTGAWTHDKGVGIWGSPGNMPVIVTKISDPPLAMLLVALEFAKKYIIEYMVRWLTEAVQTRLEDRTFEQILATAIQLDISPLRLQCIRFAENSAKVRAMYDAGDFAQPHITELQAIWPPPDKKRRRFLQ